jgi:hypothetical protein
MCGWALRRESESEGEEDEQEQVRRLRGRGGKDETSSTLWSRGRARGACGGEAAAACRTPDGCAPDTRGKARGQHHAAAATALSCSAQPRRERCRWRALPRTISLAAAAARPAAAAPGSLSRRASPFRLLLPLATLARLRSAGHVPLPRHGCQKGCTPLAVRPPSACTAASAEFSQHRSARPAAQQLGLRSRPTLRPRRAPPHVRV